MSGREIIEGQTAARACLNPGQIEQVDMITDLSLENFRDSLNLLVLAAARQTQVVYGGVLGRKIVGLGEIVDANDYADFKESLERIISSVVLKAYMGGLQGAVHNEEAIK